MFASLRTLFPLIVVLLCIIIRNCYKLSRKIVNNSNDRKLADRSYPHRSSLMSAYSNEKALPFVDFSRSCIAVCKLNCDSTMRLMAHLQYSNQCYLREPDGSVVGSDSDGGVTGGGIESRTVDGLVNAAAT